jgi:hypothetical protein
VSLPFLFLTGVMKKVYSGDDDDNCPTLGTMQWAYGLGLEPLVKWNPWYYDDALYGKESHPRK